MSNNRIGGFKSSSSENILNCEKYIQSKVGRKLKRKLLSLWKMAVLIQKKCFTLIVKKKFGVKLGPFRIILA